MAERTCSVSDCGKPTHAHGLCGPHAHRLLRYGDPLGRPEWRDLGPRFWKFVKKSDGCWEWTGSITTTGYGQIWDKDLGRPTGAHRVAYQLLIGPIPEGLHIDHLCRNRACVNPAHLEAVTNRENARRGFGACGVHARATHCPHGHPYDAENTYVNPHSGHRSCRACSRARTMR